MTFSEFTQIFFEVLSSAFRIGIASLSFGHFQDGMTFLRATRFQIYSLLTNGALVKLEVWEYSTR